MAKSKNTKQTLLNLTYGLAVTTLDLAVLMAGLTGGIIIAGMGAHPSRKNTWKIPFFIAGWIYDSWDNSKLRRAIGNSMSKGLFEKIKGGYQLTEKGKKCLEELLPSYKKQFKWDGRLWLIIYDISDNQRRQRDYLRADLEKIGCGMVQKSVWLSLKDPRPWLIPKIAELNITESVIISGLGEDGTLGDEDLPELVSRVYQLKILNERYRRWMEDLETETAGKQPINSGWRFISILESDPQLPVELLPADWLGQKAKEKFERDVLPQMGELSQYIL